MPVRADKSADRIFALIICFIAAIFAEGILRRWVLPGLGYWLIFIRDPILLLIYATAVMGGFIDRNIRPMVVLILISAIYFLIVFIQISSTALNPLIPAFGYRTYILYFPLPFIMYHFLDKNHFENIIRIIIWCSIPIGILTAIQYYSSPYSIWNAAPEGFGDVAMIEANRVRPYSVFTNSIAHVFFALIALSVFMRFLFSKRGPKFPALIIPVVGLATVIMGALSGARTYFILAPLIVALFMFGGLAGRNVRRGANIVFVSAIAILMTFSVVFFMFPDAMTTLINRQQSAVAGEGSTFGRLAFMATDFIRHLAFAQPFGAGAGLGTNIGSYIYAGRRTFAVTEYELSRIVLEFGPTFGLIHIVLRFAFVVYLFHKAMQAARHGELLPIAMMGVIIPLFTAGPLTTQNSLLSIGWFAAGLCLLACKPGVGVTFAPRQSRAAGRVQPIVVEEDSDPGEAEEDGEVVVTPEPQARRGGLVAIKQVIGEEALSGQRSGAKRQVGSRSQGKSQSKPAAGKAAPAPASPSSTKAGPRGDKARKGK